jgi:hypothetical protein
MTTPQEAPAQPAAPTNTHPAATASRSAPDEAHETDELPSERQAIHAGSWRSPVGTPATPSSCGCTARNASDSHQPARDLGQRGPQFGADDQRPRGQHGVRGCRGDDHDLLLQRPGAWWTKYAGFAVQPNFVTRSTEGDSLAPCGSAISNRPFLAHFAPLLTQCTKRREHGRMARGDSELTAGAFDGSAGGLTQPVTIERIRTRATRRSDCSGRGEGSGRASRCDVEPCQRARVILANGRLAWKPRRSWYPFGST